MNLFKLATTFPYRPATSVPDWMLGYFRRYSISFCNGLTDLDTHVSWLQSRNFTIDLRLPKPDERAPAMPLAEYSQKDWQLLVEYEGWQADSIWNGKSLSWQKGVSLQLHNRWPEPALLRRVGNCMIEFAPSGAYVEDWRLLSDTRGPLIGLRLVEEYNPETGDVYHQGGGLIVSGEYAALVLGRPDQSAELAESNALRSLGTMSPLPREELVARFQFETSVARGNNQNGFVIEHSTCPWRVGESLIALDGFDCDSEKGVVYQTFELDGKPRRRIFQIDTLESEFDFSATSTCTVAAEQWFEQESQTLKRYTRKLTLNRT